MCGGALWCCLLDPEAFCTLSVMLQGKEHSGSVFYLKKTDTKWNQGLMWICTVIANLGIHTPYIAYLNTEITQGERSELKVVFTKFSLCCWGSLSYPENSAQRAGQDIWNVEVVGLSNSLCLPVLLSHLETFTQTLAWSLKFLSWIRPCLRIVQFIFLFSQCIFAVSCCGFSESRHGCMAITEAEIDRHQGHPYCSASISSGSQGPWGIQYKHGGVGSHCTVDRPYADR